jgi:hypothetical protein
MAQADSSDVAGRGARLWRGLAAAAIAFGLLGVAPLLPDLMVHLGFITPDLFWNVLILPADLLQVLAVAGWISNNTANMIGFFGSLIIAPSLLLWGIINVHSSQRGRQRIIIGAAVLCLCTAPSGVGIILCLPIFFNVILPLMRDFKKYRGTPPTKQP